MSATVEEWKWNPLIDSELEEWLLCNDEPQIVETNNLPSTLLDSENLNAVYQDLEEQSRNESNYWLEEFPLFEEIQSLNEFKNQPEDSQNFYLKSNNEKLHDQNAIISEYSGHPNTVQDLFASSIENTTLVFSDNIVAYIRSNSHVDVPVICQEYSNAFQEKSDSLEKSPVKGDFSIDDGDTELNLLSPIASKNSEVCKMTAVDEILKNAALDLDQSDWDTSQSDVGSFSPVTTSGSSLSSTQDEESDDPEWKPSTFKSSSKGSSSIRRARNQEDRRLRKKEQNKCAATRYRLKKKAEVCELLREEEELKGKNKALKERVLDIEQEIRCLKGLMRDLFKIRGNRSVAS